MNLKFLGKFRGIPSLAQVSRGRKTLSRCEMTSSKYCLWDLEELKLETSIYIPNNKLKVSFPNILGLV